MISILQKGKYTLFQVLDGVKLLLLEKKVWGWQKNGEEEEVFITNKKLYIQEKIIQKGNFRMYRVSDEVGKLDAIYLELFLKDGERKTFLFPQGIPTKKRERKKIVLSEAGVSKLLD